MGVATFYLGLLFSKVSVSLLLLRILGRAGNKYTRGFLWSMSALAGVISVMATGGILGEYRPVWKQWDDQQQVARSGDLTVKIGIVQGGESFFFHHYQSPRPLFDSLLWLWGAIDFWLSQDVSI